jgi:uncharacterized protein YdeI (YjbR/CyaY-like superfamily)
MAKAKKNPKVEGFFEKAGRWQAEVNKLREIALGCPVEEVLKWGNPCYTVGGNNVVLIHHFKDYCALLFFKGALMKDPRKLLIQQTANVQSARQMRFTGAKEIVKLKAAIKAYILEAIKVEESGAKVEFKKAEEFAVAPEFKARLKDVPGLKQAFESLTPGRQKAYLLFFSGAKQSKTRESRVEKCLDRILDGLGLDD